MGRKDQRTRFNQVFLDHGGVLSEERFYGTSYPFSLFPTDLEGQVEAPYSSLSQSKLYAPDCVAEWRNDPKIIRPMPLVYFDYLTHPSFQVIARIDGKNEFIGFHVGAFIRLQYLFGRMLSDPDVLPDVGDASREVFVENPLGRLPSMTEIIEGFMEGYPTPIGLPQDPVRQAHARQLTVFAFEFLLAHEFAHLRNGHVHLLRAKTGLNFMLEFNQGSTSKLSALDRQALEVDADYFAGVMAFNSALLLKRTIERYPMPLRYVATTFEQSLYHRVYALYSLFALMDIIGLAAGDLQRAPETTVHPPARLRQMFLGLGWISFVDQRVPEPKDLQDVKRGIEEMQIKKDLEKILGSNIFELVERSVTRASGRVVNTETIKYPATQQGILHTKRIAEHWKVLLPQLQSYSRAIIW